MEDAAILELYQSRNEQAIAETKIKYGKLVYSIAYNILHNSEDSEECENDTYLSTWNAIPPEHPNNFSAYLSRLVRNIAISRFRANSADKRGGGEVALSLHELDECLPAPSDADTERLAEILNRFLAQLSKPERMVFIFRYWRCDSIHDIAKHLGFGESKVKMMLSRTRTKLRTFLEKEGYWNDKR